MLLHVATLYLPPAQAVLRVEPIQLDAWVRMVLVASTIVLAVELHKFIRRPRPIATTTGSEQKETSMRAAR